VGRLELAASPSFIRRIHRPSDELMLTRNNLRGALPTEIALLTKLETLASGGNFLNGNIGSEIGLLRNLSESSVPSAVSMALLALILTYCISLK
jgi:LRR receptor-like serine/threonine-protein kinase FLS2